MKREAETTEMLKCFASSEVVYVLLLLLAMLKPPLW